MRSSFRLPTILLLIVGLALSSSAFAETRTIAFGMGCFWGAEQRLAELDGVLDAENGYAGGDAETAGYRDVLELERAIRRGASHERNHAEVVLVTYNAELITAKQLLAFFWENHDPTQGDRQGKDIGSNYRSAVFYTTDQQKHQAERTRETYQKALNKAGFGRITTEIAPLSNYNRAEDYHQNYLEKNPNGYCGLAETGIAFPHTQSAELNKTPQPLDAEQLNHARQLIVFESTHCPFCEQFRDDVLDHWQADVPMVTTMGSQPPGEWQLEKPLFATPTTVLFENGQEVARFTGYQGKTHHFWEWLGFQLLTPQQQQIAFEQGTERAFTGSHLDENRPGTFVDPISGAPLFRTDSKFDSASGWPSFFQPVDGAITLHEDDSHGMQRTEVRSASSGIHLGHVFKDGPAPTGRRYCINGNVLTFVPDK